MACSASIFVCAQLVDSTAGVKGVRRTPLAAAFSLTFFHIPGACAIATVAASDWSAVAWSLRSVLSKILSRVCASG
jgi:hypothetical protein